MLRFAQHDRMEDVVPSASEGGPSALAFLGMTRWDVTPSEAKGLLFFRPLEIEGCLSTARQDRAESFIEKIRLAKSSDTI
jgi:hypothetical protein